ncbi:MAG: hypothetical protein O9262_11325, partial [Cyclobacteriaceae bacterium]|nr:hypothetical protein [Cyclobacteriaceae bacterium]
KPISSYQRAYDDKLFCLYKSHSMQEEGGALPVEELIDKRGNILKSKIFIVALIFLFLSVFAARFLWSFFHPAEKHPAISKHNPEFQLPSKQPTLPMQLSIKQPTNKADYRIVGTVKKSGVLYYALQNESGQIRYISEPSIKDYGIDKEIFFDGITANTWERYHDANTPAMPLINR